MEPVESLSCLICVFSYLINYSGALTYYIPEEQTINTKIGNIAIDENLRELVGEEEFRKLEYHFLNLDNEYLAYFSIDSVTSDLSIKKQIDWEVVCEFSTSSTCPMTFDVAAQSKFGTFFKKISVTVVLEDINDHNPSFNTPSISLRISESEVTGKSIVIDAASDLDSANFSVQSYEIIPSNVPFKAVFQQISDSSTLSIVVDGELDREEVDSYHFLLIAIDGGDPPLNGSMMVNISIEDDNDNRPVFEKSVYPVVVKENYPLNVSFLRVQATDRDIGRNAEISYHLSSQQSQAIKDTFNINSSTGDLYLVDQLEYVSDVAIKVKIEAVDNGERPLSSIATVEVTVEDSENNVPEIKINLLSNSGVAETSEYASVGSVVSYVEVTDSDGGRNGLVSCSVENKFFGLQAMEPKEYKIIVFSTLDRETDESHNVTITCHDFGVPQLTASAEFTVIVLDENDSTPKFTKEEYTATTLENNKVGSTIVQVLAVDDDIGFNGQVSYYLEPEDQVFFSVNPKTGVVTANVSFDREERAVYQFMLHATDAGNPPLHSATTISVTINDVNDNAPVFDKEIFKYYIPESESKETVLGRVLAEDADLGGNGYVSYSLYGNYSDLPFEVLPDGTVKTTDSLDRELIPSYTFQVMAIDNGIDVRLSSTVDVTVFVTDINDHSPVITFPNDINFRKYITYMMPVDTQIMKVEATDEDEGKHADLTYSVTARNDSKMFHLGRNGEISVARRLTENDVGLYYLDITVSDLGTPPNQAFTRVTIVVLMKNVTALDVQDDSIDNKNIIIAVVVVIVTVAIAAPIIIFIWVVRRRDIQKRKYLESRAADSMNVHNQYDYAPGVGNKSPTTNKVMTNGVHPTAPILTPITIDRLEVTPKDVTFQDPILARKQSTDSNMEQNGHNSQQLHRLASLRLQQALIQNNTKHWPSQSELNPDGKRPDDCHGDDLSGDTATYDSGMGGSVSDTGDLRITQLQQIVKQNGRRGQPPHKATNPPTKPPRIIARGRSNCSDFPPERPPPLKNSLYKSKSPVQSPVHYSSRGSPSQFAITSSPTPCSPNQLQFTSPASSPTKFNMDRQSPSKSVVQDLLMYKKFQNGLRQPIGRMTVDESVDTTHVDDDGSTTSGSYYIDNPVDDWQHPPVSDIYV